MEPSPVLALVIYCLLILAASLAGGWVPLVLRLDHRRMELLVSFVSGVMLGVAILHLLPDALVQRGLSLVGQQGAQVSGSAREVIIPVVSWLLAGFLVMFFVERFVCFHHHEAPGDDAGHTGHGAAHGHELTWTGAAIGLTVHSLVSGTALAAAVLASDGAGAGRPVGLGVFLAIVLHKPFDSMTLGALMAVNRSSPAARHLVNGAFALVVPIGAALFAAGVGRAAEQQAWLVSSALAFSAGTFLCISLSDLLPELQFHRHDRVKLSVALVLGLAVAWGSQRIEGVMGDTVDAAGGTVDAASASPVCFGYPPLTPPRPAPPEPRAHA